MVSFKSKLFIGIVTANLILNLLVGTFNFLVSLNFIYLLTLPLSVLLLILIYKKHGSLVLWIKIWAAIVSVGGIAGLVSSCATYVHITSGGTELSPEGYAVRVVLKNIILVAFGFFYFVTSSKFIIKTESSLNNSSQEIQSNVST
jgi:hypothetical protein